MPRFLTHPQRTWKTSARHWRNPSHRRIVAARHVSASRPQENVWEWLRKNKLALSVFDNCDHILEACCKARHDFIADPAMVASVTRRDRAKAIKT